MKEVTLTMSPLVTAEIVISGICLAVGLLHLTIYLRRRELAADLSFAVMCLGTAVSAMLNALLYQSGDLATFTPMFKWQVSVQGSFWIALIWFVAFYTGESRRWLVWAATSAYIVAIAINIAKSNIVAGT